jgi:[ribosomal protein S5]-alanine N-acetyltransferase
MEPIRPLTLDDADVLAALLSRNRGFLAPFEPQRSPHFFTPAGQRERLADALASQDAGDAFSFGILDGSDLAGVISLTGIARGPLQSANVGYWVDGERNGRGLASAALAAVVAEAFGALALHRLQAGTLVDNVASQRVLEKNRFTRIGLAPRYLRIADDWRDHILFQRTCED